MNIIINDLLSLVERWVLDPAFGFFFEMTKEVLHGGIVPDVPSSRHRLGHVILISEDMIRVGNRSFFAKAVRIQYSVIVVLIFDFMHFGSDLHQLISRLTHYISIVYGDKDSTNSH